MLHNLKIAIVHEWFDDYSGSEKVVEQLVSVFPQASLFAIVDHWNEKQKKEILLNKSITTTFIQHLPFSRKRFRNYLPLMPLAIEQLDVSGFDIIISSSHAVAKGVLANANQLHISYVHTPARYAWDLYHQYMQEASLTKGLKGLLAKLTLHYIRLWDVATANRVDYFIANSNYIARRIKRTYNRASETIYPPVDISRFDVETNKDDFYLTASRLVPYKKVDLIVEAFNSMPDKKLIVIGTGPEIEKLTLNASSNVQVLGYQDSQTLVTYMQKAKAFIFAADEDFGITPVEAQACGTPVIAFGKGGSLETVIEHKTGMYFSSQTEDSLIDAIIRFEQSAHFFDPYIIRGHAEKFDSHHFCSNILAFVEAKYVAHKNGM